MKRILIIITILIAAKASAQREYREEKKNIIIGIVIQSAGLMIINKGKPTEGGINYQPLGHSLVIAGGAISITSIVDIFRKERKLNTYQREIR